MSLFGKKTIEEKKAEEISAMNKYMCIKAKHQAGLPLPMDLDCTISIEMEKFIFLSGNNKFELSFEKIADICIKTDTEIENQYVSSIGGTIAGGALFGPLGAIVGGRVKEKKQIKNINYIIFTYKKENGIEFISFELGYKEDIKANEIVKYFRKNIQQSVANTVVL